MSKKTTLIVTFAVILLCAVSLISVFSGSQGDAVSAAGIWDGKTGSIPDAEAAFSGGEGSAINPYLISSPSDLAQLGANINAGIANYSHAYYLQTQDIYLNDTSSYALWGESISPTNFWTPIGNNITKSFSGSYNGGNNTVFGLYVNTENLGAGLFGIINAATVSNLYLAEGYVIGKTYVGGIAGYATLSDFKNCHNDNSLISAESHAGGIAGNAAAVEFAYCSNSGKISGKAYSGGIVGEAIEADISGCFNFGEVSATLEYAGGIAARIYRGIVADCHNKSQISASEYAGGVCGIVDNSQFDNCNNDGTIIMQNGIGGGIAGAAENSLIKNSFNKGKIQALSGSLPIAAGGILGSGLADTLIQNSYNNGNIDSNIDYVGGIVGTIDGGTVANCYNTGSVFYGTGVKGGVAARSLNADINYCYYLGGEGVGVAEGTDNTVSFDADNLLAVSVGGDHLKDALKWWRNNQATPSDYLIWKNQNNPTLINIWDGTAATSFAYGKGTANDPYRIANANQLCLLSLQGDLQAHYRLIDDIYLNNPDDLRNLWTPIGSFGAPFSGVFDGNGCEVFGLYIDSMQYAGLFGVISTAVVENIGIVGGNISVASNGGFIVGCMHGGRISNCYTVSTRISNTSGSSIGGIVGYCSGGVISGCNSSCRVYCFDSLEVGGIAGVVEQATIKDCHFYGDIYGALRVGGIAGKANNGTSIINCYNSGHVEGREYVGGIVGSAVSCTAINCYNTEEIWGNSLLGGMAGEAIDSELKCIYNSGAIKGVWETSAGSIAGFAWYSTMQYCYYQEGTASQGIADGEDNIGFTVAFPESLVPFDHDNDIATPDIALSAALNQGVADGMHPDSRIWQDNPGSLPTLNTVGHCDGIIVEKFAEGSGTEGNPFIIETAAQLNLLAAIANATEPQYLVDGFVYSYNVEDVRSAYFKIAADIWLNDESFIFDDDSGLIKVSDGIHTAYLGTGIKGDISGASAVFDAVPSVKGQWYADTDGTLGAYGGMLYSWTPIGESPGTSFSGVIDGCGYSVYGLYINKQSSDYLGLFGIVNQAVIDNLNIQSGAVLGADSTGGLVGHLLQESSISSCSNNAVVCGNNYVGGVVGAIGAESALSDCHNLGTIRAVGSYAGGIAGDCEGQSNITNSTNSASVGGASHVGGIVGRMSVGTITTCYNLGDIYAGEGYVGGICGSIYYSAVLNACNIGKIYSIGGNVGGIFGYVQASALSTSYNTGSVAGNSTVGGIAGYASYADINSAYVGNGTTLSGQSQVGAIVGGAVNSAFGNCYYGNVGLYNGIGNSNDIGTVAYCGDAARLDHDNDFDTGYVSLLYALNIFSKDSPQDETASWAQLESGKIVLCLTKVTSLPRLDNYWVFSIRIKDIRYGEPLAPESEAAFGNDALYYTYCDTVEGSYLSAEHWDFDIGTWYIKANIDATQEYIGLVSDAVRFSVATARLVKPSAVGSYTYDGSIKALILANYDDQKMTPSGQTTARDAATYQAIVSLDDTARYEWEDGSTDDVSIVWTIEKANYDMDGITFASASFIYDGKSHSLEVGGELPWGADGIQASVSYSGSATNVQDGKVTVVANFATASNNYNTPSMMLAEVSILPKEVAATWVGPFSWVYDGLPHAPHAFVDTGIDGESLPLVVQGEAAAASTSAYTAVAVMEIANADYTLANVSHDFYITKARLQEPTADGAYVYDGTEQTAEMVDFDPQTMVIVFGNKGAQAGDYTLIIQLADNSNFEWAAGSDGIIIWTICSYANNWIAPLIITDWTYGDLPISPLAEAAFGETIFTYSFTEDGEYTSHAPVNAGSYWVKAFVPSTQNYSSLENKAAYEIHKAVLSDNTQEISVIYDGSTYYLDVKPDGFVNGEDIGVASLSFSEDGQSYSPSNIGITNVDESKTIFYKAEFDNYVIVSGAKSISIAPKDIQIKIFSDTSVYGEGQKELRYLINNAVIIDGDELGVVLTKEAGLTVGEYAIGGSVANGNYHATFSGGIYTITKASLSDITQNVEVVYNGNQHGITLALEGFVYGDDFTLAVPTYSLDGINYYSDNFFCRDVGEIVVHYRVDFDNYSTVSGAKTVAIAVRNATITIADKSSIEGAALATLTYSPQNTLEGDELNIVISKADGTAPGKYPITGTFANDNYAVTFVNGIYTIRTSVLAVQINGDSIGRIAEITSPVGFEPGYRMIINDVYEDIFWRYKLSKAYESDNMLADAFEIAYTDEQGDHKPLGGMATVKIKLKASANPESIAIFRLLSDGSVVAVDRRTEEGCLYFDILHDGNYLVISEAKTLLIGTTTKIILVSALLFLVVLSLAITLAVSGKKQ